MIRRNEEIPATLLVCKDMARASRMDLEFSGKKVGNLRDNKMIVTDPDEASIALKVVKNPSKSCCSGEIQIEAGRDLWRSKRLRLQKTEKIFLYSLPTGAWIPDSFLHEGGFCGRTPAGEPCALPTARVFLPPPPLRTGLIIAAASRLSSRGSGFFAVRSFLWHNQPSASLPAEQIRKCLCLH